MSAQNVVGSVGSFLSFSSVLPADETVEAYAGLTYTESDLEISVGELGASTEVITFNLIKSGQVVKRLGSTDSGQLACEFAFDAANPAQILLKAHAADRTAVAVRETLADGSQYFFQAFVSSAKTNVGSTSDITKFMSNLEIATAILEN